MDRSCWLSTRTLTPRYYSWRLEDLDARSQWIFIKCRTWSWRPIARFWEDDTSSKNHFFSRSKVSTNVSLVRLIRGLAKLTAPVTSTSRQQTDKVRISPIAQALMSWQVHARAQELTPASANPSAPAIFHPSLQIGRGNPQQQILL